MESGMDNGTKLAYHDGYKNPRRDSHSYLDVYAYKLVFEKNHEARQKTRRKEKSR